MPGGYGPQPGQVLRNGSYPVVSETSGGDSGPPTRNVVTNGEPIQEQEGPNLSFIPNNLNTIQQGPTRQGRVHITDNATGRGVVARRNVVY